MHPSSDDPLDKLLAAMESDDDKPNDLDSSNDEDDDAGEGKVEDIVEYEYEEDQCFDVDSVVQKVNTEALRFSPALQVVTVVNYPVKVVECKGQICIAEFGWRLFVRVTMMEKLTICCNLRNFGVRISASRSEFVFARGRLSIALYMLVDALVQAQVEHVTMAGPVEAHKAWSGQHTWHPSPNDVPKHIFHSRDLWTNSIYG